MGVLNEAMEKLLKFFISLKGDDWVQWIAQKNDWQDDCDKFVYCEKYAKISTPCEMSMQIRKDQQANS